jgi:hypothetical protein
VRDTGTTATGIVAHVRVTCPGRQWRKFDLARLPGWTTHGFTPLDGQGVERATDGNWRTIKDRRQLLPVDWRTGWTKVYVDPIKGNDTASGADWTNAVRSLSRAIELVVTKKLIIVPDGAKFWYTDVSGGPWAARSANEITTRTIILPESVLRNNGVGDAAWTCSVEVEMDSWTAVSGQPGVYFGTRVDVTNSPNLSSALAGSINSGAVFQFTPLDPYGLPIRYQRVEESAVANTAYSYSATADTNKIKVNIGRSAGATPDHLRVYLCSVTNALVGRAAEEVHVVNCIFEGGNDTFRINGAGSDSATFKVRFYNCQFRLAAGGKCGVKLNGTLSGSGINDVGLYDCVSAGNGWDGISYLGDSRFIESNCTSYGNGYVRDTSPDYGKANGFTSHYRTKGIRTGCVAYANGGSNYSDSGYQGSVAVAILGCFSYDSNGDREISQYATDFTVSPSPPGTGFDGISRVWLIDPKYASPEGRSSNSLFNINLDANNGGVDPYLWFNGDWPARIRLSGGATTVNVTRIAFPP